MGRTAGIGVGADSVRLQAALKQCDVFLTLRQDAVGLGEQRLTLLIAVYGSPILSVLSYTWTPAAGYYVRVLAGIVGLVALGIGLLSFARILGRYHRVRQYTAALNRSLEELSMLTGVGSERIPPYRSRIPEGAGLPLTFAVANSGLAAGLGVLAISAVISSSDAAALAAVAFGGATLVLHVLVMRRDRVPLWDRPIRSLLGLRDDPGRGGHEHRLPRPWARGPQSGVGGRKDPK